MSQSVWLAQYYSCILGKIMSDVPILPHYFTPPRTGEVIVDGAYELYEEIHCTHHASERVFLAASAAGEVAIRTWSFKDETMRTTAEWAAFDRYKYALANVDSPFVIGSEGAGILHDKFGSEGFYVVMPAANERDMTRPDHAVYDRKTAENAWLIGLDIARGLRDLHAAGFINSNVHPGSMLVHGGRGVVGGLNRVVAPHAETVHDDEPAFTFDPFEGDKNPRQLCFTALEQMTAVNQYSFDSRADICSWAISLLTIFNDGKNPFAHSIKIDYEVDSVVRNLRTKDARFDYKKYIPKDVYTLLLTCIDPDPERRPVSFEAVLDLADPAAFERDYEDGNLTSKRITERNRLCDTIPTLVEPYGYRPRKANRYELPFIRPSNVNTPERSSRIWLKKYRDPTVTPEAIERMLFGANGIPNDLLPRDSFVDIYEMQNARHSIDEIYRDGRTDESLIQTREIDVVNE